MPIRCAGERCAFVCGLTAEAEGKAVGPIASKARKQPDVSASEKPRAKEQPKRARLDGAETAPADQKARPDGSSPSAPPTPLPTVDTAAKQGAPAGSAAKETAVSGPSLQEISKMKVERRFAFRSA